jgi:hypothetical protein
MAKTALYQGRISGAARKRPLPGREAGAKPEGRERRKAHRGYLPVRAVRADGAASGEGVCRTALPQVQIVVLA